ncbi:MAG: hypothetical protein OXC02_03220 [Rhodobacteraceae bacterium]|nr:hypothetical protein [Paracoccaceae bacterium]
MLIELNSGGFAQEVSLFYQNALMLIISKQKQRAVVMKLKTNNFFVLIAIGEEVQSDLMIL